MSDNLALKRAVETAVCGLKNAGFDVISKRLENGIQLTITPKPELTEEKPFTYPEHGPDTHNVFE